MIPDNRVFVSKNFTILVSQIDLQTLLFLTILNRFDYRSFLKQKFTIHIHQNTN